MVITDEENGEHVTDGCGELHVADVSNQICLAKSPNKGKGGKALPNLGLQLTASAAEAELRRPSSHVCGVLAQYMV